MMTYENKTVIVTGGGKGVGKGISEAFLEAGADVIICGRNKPEHLPQVSERKAQFIEADVRQSEAAISVVEFAVAQTGRLDVLINNAGGGPPVDAASASPRLSSSIITLNLLAPLLFSQAAYKAMRETLNAKGPSCGAIVNIASVAGDRPSPGTAAYGAAKAGLLNLTQSLAMEWAPHVRVNAIIAGLIKTEAAYNHYGGSKGVAYIESTLPMERMAVPSDIANACLYLASDYAAYISGASLAVHGGGEPPSFLKMVESALESQSK